MLSGSLVASCQVTHCPTHPLIERYCLQALTVDRPVGGGYEGGAACYWNHQAHQWPHLGGPKAAQEEAARAGDHSNAFINRNI